MGNLLEIFEKKIGGPLQEAKDAIEECLANCREELNRDEVRERGNKAALVRMRRSLGGMKKKIIPIRADLSAVHKEIAPFKKASLQ